MRELIKNEFKGWKTWEVVWLVAACLIITGLSIYWGDTLMGIFSATTGVACVVLTGKGKLSAYLFGLINCVLYAIIAYEAKYYGEVAFNAISIPLQIVGFVTWSKNMNQETNEVVKKRMSNMGRIVLAGIILLGTIILSAVLKILGGEMPLVDSFTTVTSFIAMVISVRMFSEQWYLWCIINAASMVLWVGNLVQGTDNWATFLMWCTYLFNSVIMLIKWEKEVKVSK